MVKDLKPDKELTNMPIGFGLALRIKGKLKSLFDDLDDKPSHPQRERENLKISWGKCGEGPFSYGTST